MKATDKASKLFQEEYKAKTHFDRARIEGAKEEGGSNSISRSSRKRGSLACSRISALGIEDLR